MSRRAISWPGGRNSPGGKAGLACSNPGRGAAGALSDRDALGLRAGLLQHRPSRGEVVVKHHVRLGQQPRGAQGQEFGVARTRGDEADKVDLFTLPRLSDMLAS